MVSSVVVCMRFVACRVLLVAFVFQIAQIGAASPAVSQTDEGSPASNCRQCLAIKRLIGEVSSDLATRIKERSAAWRKVQEIDSEIRAIKVRQDEHRRQVSEAIAAKRRADSALKRSDSKKQLKALAEITSQLDTSAETAFRRKDVQFERISWLNKIITRFKAEMKTRKAQSQSCTTMCVVRSQSLKPQIAVRETATNLVKLSTKCSDCTRAASAANTLVKEMHASEAVVRDINEKIESVDAEIDELETSDVGEINRSLAILRQLSRFDLRSSMVALDGELADVSVRHTDLNDQLRQLFSERRGLNDEMAKARVKLTAVETSYRDAVASHQLCSRACLTQRERERLAEQDAKRKAEQRLAAARKKSEQRLKSKSNSSVALTLDNGVAETESKSQARDDTASKNKQMARLEKNDQNDHPDEKEVLVKNDLRLPQTELKAVKQNQRLPKSTPGVSVVKKMAAASEPDAEVDDDGGDDDIEFVETSKRRRTSSAKGRSSDEALQDDDADFDDEFAPLPRHSLSFAVGYGFVDLPSSRFFAIQPGGRGPSFDDDLDVVTYELRGERPSGARIFGLDSPLAWEAKIVIGSNSDNPASLAAGPGTVVLPSPNGATFSFLPAGNDLTGLRHSIDYHDIHARLALLSPEVICGAMSKCHWSFLAGLRTTRFDEDLSGAIAAGSLAFDYQTELDTYAATAGLRASMRTQVTELGAAVPVSLLFAAEAHLMAGFADGKAQLSLTGQPVGTASRDQGFVGAEGEISAAIAFDFNDAELQIGAELSVQSEPHLQLDAGGGLDLSTDTTTSGAVFVRGKIRF